MKFFFARATWRPGLVHPCLFVTSSCEHIIARNHRGQISHSKSTEYSKVEIINVELVESWDSRDEK